MIIETGLRDLVEGQVCVEILTIQVQKVSSYSYASAKDSLEFLVFIDNLETMFILLLGRLIANIGKVTVHGHDRWSSRMSIR